MKKITALLAKLPPGYKRVILFGGIVAIVMVISGTVAILLTLRQSSSNTPEETGETSQLQELPAEREAGKAEKMAVQGNLEGGVQKLDTEIEKTENSEDKYIFYSHKATLLFNHQKYDEALAAALEAYKLRQSSDSAAFVGQIAMEKGDNALALEYYKKAIPLIDKNDPFADEDKVYYEGIIAGLEGGQ